MTDIQTIHGGIEGPRLLHKQAFNIGKLVVTVTVTTTPAGAGKERMLFAFDGLSPRLLPVLSQRFKEFLEKTWQPDGVEVYAASGELKRQRNGWDVIIVGVPTFKVDNTIAAVCGFTEDFSKRMS